MELRRSSLSIACLIIERDASSAAVEFGELVTSRVSAPSKIKQLSASGDSIVHGPLHVKNESAISIYIGHTFLSFV